MNILRRRRKSKKKINATRLVWVIFFLMMTTFAWFTYSRVLNLELDIHMVSWDVQFFKYVGEELVEETSDAIEIVAPTLYPGMEDLIYEVKVKNNGEMTVDLAYYIEELEIIGNTYDILEGTETTTNDFYIKPGEITTADNISTQSILNDTENYPFTIDVEYTVLIGKDEEGYVKLKISWPGTNDELDSKWGHDVGKYFMENADATSAMRLLLRADVIQGTI